MANSGKTAASPPRRGSIRRVLRRAVAESAATPRWIFVWVNGDRCGCCLAARKVDGRNYVFAVGGGEMVRVGR